jgi:hypothetical protein
MKDGTSLLLQRVNYYIVIVMVILAKFDTIGY